MHHPQKVKESGKRPGPRPARRRLLYFGVALALAVALVLLLPQIKRIFPSPVAANLSGGREFQVLDKADPQELRSISVTHLGGEAYTLLYREGELLLQGAGEGLLPVDPALSENILEAATVITVQDTVTRDGEEVRGHLEDMGLAPPQIEVRVLYQGGREDTLSLGWKVPETGYYYFRWSGDPGVYMCDQGIYQSFEYTARLLLPVERVALAQPLIDRIRLRLRGQELLELGFATDGQGSLSAALESPFFYPLDVAAAQALLTTAAQFRLGAPREDITWENRGDYGFEGPLAEVEIHQREGVLDQVDEAGALVPGVAPEQILAFVLGEKAGDFFYTCQYGGRYYDVSSVLVEAFVNTTLEGLLSKYPGDMEPGEVAALSVLIRGRPLELRKEKTERVLPNNQLDNDPAGNILYDVQATLNGGAIAVDTFDNLVGRLAAMRVSGQVEEGFALPEEAAPRWRLTLVTEEGISRTLEGYAVNPFFDAVAVDGVVRHTMHGEAVEIALGELLE